MGCRTKDAAKSNGNVPRYNGTMENAVRHALCYYMKNNDPISQMIKAKAVLSPMSGITDLPFRMMARKFGCAFAFTEMVDINGIVYKNRKSLKYLERAKGDEPLGIQLVGQDLEKFLIVAEICEEKGFALIDINAGCPARKVVKAGKGAALMRDTAKLAKIVSGVARHVSIPVTVKIRSGWDEDNLNYLETAKAVEAEGASAICIHSRTKEQMYRGKAEHNVTRETKEAVGIPVFASGNIFTAKDAVDVLKYTGCDGVFVARGALGKPWVFREISDMINGKTVQRPPSFNELKDVIRKHFKLQVRYYGEFLAFKRMYKHMTWYLKRYKNIDDVMKVFLKVEDAASFGDLMDRLILDENGRLRLIAS